MMKFLQMCIRDRLSEELKNTHNIIIGVERFFSCKTLNNYLTPVSYTHLDVYKRQSQKSKLFKYILSFKFTSFVLLY